MEGWWGSGDDDVVAVVLVDRTSSGAKRLRGEIWGRTEGWTDRFFVVVVALVAVVERRREEGAVDDDDDDLKRLENEKLSAEPGFFSSSCDVAGGRSGNFFVCSEDGTKA